MKYQLTRQMSHDPVGTIMGTGTLMDVLSAAKEYRTLDQRDGFEVVEDDGRGNFALERLWNEATETVTYRVGKAANLEYSLHFANGILKPVCIFRGKSEAQAKAILSQVDPADLPSWRVMGRVKADEYMPATVYLQADHWLRL